MDEVDDDITDRCERAFMFHAPHGDQFERYEVIRATAYGFALQLNRYCPPSRELSLALTKLEEVVMWANAAIAGNEVWNGND
ncbi:MAG: hypothetical protein KJ749_01525 [Planctomycetes bacterium]|nr:hypothetical protein [Planctomycetota bacterium]